MGRPSTRTPEIVEGIIRRVRLGSSLRMAAQGEGVPWSTMTAWLRDCDDFRDQCNRAWADGCAAWQAKLERIGVEEVPDASAVAQVAKFYLSNHDREAWAEPQRIEHSGNVGIFQAAAATLKDRDRPEDEVAGE